MPGLIGLYARSHHPLSIALRSADRWGRASHVGTLTSDGTVIEALWDRGVVETPLEEFNARYTHIEPITHECPNPAAGIAFGRAQVGKPYDRLSIFGNLLRQSWHHPDAWQCAELREAILGAAGRWRFRGATWRISPNLSLMVR
jgi:hypothetical protein